MRFAVIGTNNITDRYITASQLCPDFQLTTVYSRDIARAKSYAEKWGAPHYTDSLEELANSHHVDSVYIASPNICHAPQSIQMLQGGKHVICEKPIAKDSEQLAQMLAVAQANDRILLEAIRPAFLPSVQCLKDSMDKIGTIRRVNMVYAQYSSRYDNFKQGIKENAFDPTLYNGALMDIGVYCVHMMVMLFGKPEKTTSCGIMLKDSIDGMGSSIWQYEDTIGEISYSKIHESNAPSHIEGEKGTIHFSRTSIPDDIYITYPDGSKEVVYAQKDDHDMRFETQAFMDIIGGKLDVKQYNDYSILVMAIMDEMRADIGITFA